MKKISALFLTLSAFIYQITIGQTIETPVFKDAEGLVTKSAPKKCDHKMIGYLGVQPIENPETPYGLTVSILENGPSAKAGLSGENVFLSLDGKPVARWEDLTTFLEATKPGQKVEIEIGQGESILVKTVELGQNKAHCSPNCAPKPKKRFHHFEENYPNKPACLGVFGQTGWAETDLPEGTKVTDLVAFGAAEKVGIAVGDIILSVDGVPVETFGKLHKTIGEYAPGDIVKVDFLRGDKRFSVEATLTACNNKPVQSRSSLDKIVVKWPDAIKPQIIENQSVAPQSKLELESFSAFPNPVSDEVTIRFSGEKLPIEISLFTSGGQALFSEKLDAFDGQYEQLFDLRALPKGLVIFSVKQNGKMISEEILVQ